MPKTPSNNPFQFFQDFEEGREVRPTFSHFSLKRQLDEGAIDRNDYMFLGNVLDAYRKNPDILKDVYEFRKLTNQGGIPDVDIFVTMQNMGCRSYPFGLDITGLILSEVKLNRAKIGRNLKMCYTTAEKDVDQTMMEVKGNVDMSGLYAGGDVLQQGIQTGGGVIQEQMVVKGDVSQTGAVINGSLVQTMMEVGKRLDQTNIQVRGRVDLRGAIIKQLDQTDAHIKDGTDLKGAQIEAVYQGNPDE